MVTGDMVTGDADGVGPDAGAELPGVAMPIDLEEDPEPQPADASRTSPISTAPRAFMQV
jgi:hypothetical protein